MIKYTEGDILLAKVDAIINPVNTFGVMGAGLALQFKTKFPDNYQAYKIACDESRIKTGKIFLYELKTKKPKYIINFPTKNHWKDPSKIEYIRDGLENLIEEIQCLNINSIAIPALGCGLGGLKWDVVKPMIHNTFVNLHDLEVYIYNIK